MAREKKEYRKFMEERRGRVREEEARGKKEKDWVTVY